MTKPTRRVDGRRDCPPEPSRTPDADLDLVVFTVVLLRTAEQQENNMVRTGIQVQYRPVSLRRTSTLAP